MKVPWYIFRIPFPTTKLITLGFFMIGNTGLLDDPSILEHELTHVKRQFMFLLIPWFLLYIIPSFRRKEELIAYTNEVVYRYKHNMQIDKMRYEDLMVSTNTYGIQIFKTKQEVNNWLNDCRTKG